MAACREAECITTASFWKGGYCAKAETRRLSCERQSHRHTGHDGTRWMMGLAHRT